MKINDEIIAINGIHIKADFAEWSRYFFDEKVELTMISDGHLQRVTLIPSKEEYYKVYYVNKILSPSEDQVKAFNAWSKRKF